VERELSEDDDSALINLVRIQTNRNEMFDALWDEEKLAIPINQSMGKTVEIKPTNDATVWSVIKILENP